MAQQCLYGSEPAIGAPEYIVFDTSNLGGWIGIAASLLTNAMMGLPIGPVPTAQFCAQAPSGDLPVGPDYDTLWNPALALTTGAYGRFGNQAKQEMFAEVCYCIAPAPEDTPCYQANNPLTLPAQSGGFSLTVANEFTVTSPLYATHIDVWSPAAHTQPSGQTMFLWEGTSAGITRATGHTFDPGVTIPAGRSRWSLPVAFELLPGETYTVGWQKNASASYYEWNTTGGAPMPPLEMHVTYVEGRYGSSSPNNHFVGGVFGVWPAVCDLIVAHEPDPPPPLVPPGGYPAPPSLDCSDGASICAKIDTLATKLDMTISRIDLIQRQIVPFAYVPGPTHAGLVGQGSFAVQGILGLRVWLTTVPSYIGSKGNTVPTLIEAGWITLGTPDGDLKSEMIAHDSFVMLDISPAVTVVRYDLAPGVVASILELIREP